MAHKLRYLARTLTQCQFFYCLVCSKNEFHAELRRLKISPDTWPTFCKRGDWAHCSYFEHSSGNKVAMVCIDLEAMRGRDPVAVCALLVHEAVHIWQRHAEEIGAGNDHGAEEEAYAIQMLSLELMAEFRRRVTA